MHTISLRKVDQIHLTSNHACSSFELLLLLYKYLSTIHVYIGSWNNTVFTCCKKEESVKDRLIFLGRHWTGEVKNGVSLKVSRLSGCFQKWVAGDTAVIISFFLVIVNEDTCLFSRHDGAKRNSKNARCLTSRLSSFRRTALFPFHLHCKNGFVQQPSFTKHAILETLYRISRLIFMSS